jgi:hypothetical protein
MKENVVSRAEDMRESDGGRLEVMFQAAIAWASYKYLRRIGRRYVNIVGVLSQ